MGPAQIRGGMDIGLITINTWKCDGDYFRRRQALAAGLQYQHPGPQVILCQECFRTIDEKVDTLGFLSAALNMPAWFVPCRQKHRSLEGIMTDSFSGLGILTNLPVSHQTAIDLPSHPADGGRKAQLLTVEIFPGVSMLMVNVHLTHLRNSEALRIQQLETVLREIQCSDAAYRIIGGDFNAEIYSTEIQLLKGRGQVADCYQLGGGQEPRCTLLSSRQDSTPQCVDHLFVSGPAAKPHPLFTRSEIILDRPDRLSGLYPSDHFGIRVHLLIPD
jgi:endonuclease/exonuclease/phosphatase family metal-dependent hydrolase